MSFNNGILIKEIRVFYDFRIAFNNFFWFSTTNNSYGSKSLWTLFIINFRVEPVYEPS